MTELVAEYDNFHFHTTDPVFYQSIITGRTEPYPCHLDIVQKYVTMFPDKNRTYIDVGAHIGTTVLPYSRIFNNVVAYEPNPHTYDYLKKNVEVNEIQNVKIYNLALFSELCRGVVIQHNYGNSGCFHFQKKENGFVLARTLDSESIRKKIEEIDFIKLDAGGCEYLILQGGKQTIMKNKPLIQIETNENAMQLFQVDHTDTFQFLYDLGYQIFDDSIPNAVFLHCPL